MRLRHLLGMLIGQWLIVVGYSQPVAVNLDLALPVGACEVDWDGDGLVDGLGVTSPWSDWRSAIGGVSSLDPNRKVEGAYSQHLRFSRNAGEAGTLTLYITCLSSSTSLPVAEEQPFVVRLSYFTENFQNAQYRFRVRSGSRTIYLTPFQSTNSNGWQRLSFIVPAERNSTGVWDLTILLDIQLGAGAAAGRLWIDDIQCLWIQYPLHILPDLYPIQLATINDIPSSWVDYLLNYPPRLGVQPAKMGYPLKKLLGERFLYLQYVGISTTPIDPEPSCASLYGCGNVRQQHPDWILYDTSGNPIIDQRYGNYLINPGVDAVRVQAVGRLTEIAATLPAIDGFFFDTLGGWPGANTAGYPTYDSILPAWTGWVNYVAPRVRQTLGKKIIANIGSKTGLFLNGSRPAEQWLQQLDGIMLEGAFVRVDYTNRTYNPTNYRGGTTSYNVSSWQGIMQVVRNHPDKMWVLIGYWDSRDSQARWLRYGLASYWLLYRPNVYLYMEDRLDPAYHYVNFVSRPEIFIPLGTPLADLEVIQGSWDTGGLFQRRFQYGIVLVNPTENNTYQYTTTRSYKNWDGQVLPANTRLDIPPKTGVVLYAAPELRLSISTDRQSALPGELVTVSVECRNTGLETASNVEIQVPLPDGLTVVSTSGGGTVVNRTVKWGIASLAPGGVLRFQFQARLE
ncbi:hypothetical protein HRbin15_01833 [bacterium HR15]|nr:hypothetical protein HRbin15_01833 [bacterium HR15]